MPGKSILFCEISFNPLFNQIFFARQENPNADTSAVEHQIDAPVGVCKKCGTKYYSANILKTIESTICDRRKAENEISMAVYSL